MPRLRSILVTHNVDFSSTAKKAQLVQLVEDEVLPQAPKLRAQKARAKRSSMGIVNAGSAEDVNNWAEQDLAPTPGTSRRSKTPRTSSGRSHRVKSEEVDEQAIFSPPKRASRSVSRALSHADDEPDQPTPRNARRISRRTVTPSVKEESESEPEMPVDEDESFFSNDNVFQSGSSPPISKTPRGNRRSSGLESSKSTQSARRTTSGASQLSMARQRPRRSTPFEEVEPTEEFTPDEQLELEEAANNGEVVMPARRQQKAKTGPSLFSRIGPVFLLVLVALYGGWYRQEKIAVGYCGLGRPATEVIPPGFPVPDKLLEFVEPQCEECPAHAYCYENFVARCEPDFILRHHPLSLGGLIPLPPTCEPDSEKERRKQAVADKAIEVLRERRAQYECGELKDQGDNVEDSPSMNEEELKETVSRKRSKKLNSAEFEDLWVAAIGEVTAREEIEAETIKPVVQTTERPIPPPFQTENSRPPLSLAFHSAAPSGAGSEEGWQGINSQLDF